LTADNLFEIPAEEAGFKACRATLYESAAVRYLLGDSWRPGGKRLTADMLSAAGAGPNQLVLDVACGAGDSGEILARSFGSLFIGVDLSISILERARDRCADLPYSSRMAWLAGEAQRLPFRDANFDIVMVQCAFSTFPRRPEVLREIARVLKPGGRLTLADVTLEPASLPEELAGLVARAACVADALPLIGYVQSLSEAGFEVEAAKDCPEAAREFLRSIDKKLLMARVAQAVGKLDFAGLDVKEARRILKKAVQLVDEGQLSYAYLVGRRILT